MFKVRSGLMKRRWVGGWSPFRKGSGSGGGGGGEGDVLLTPDSGRGRLMTSLLMTSPGSGCCWTGSPQRHWGPSRARRTRAGAG